MSNNPVVSIVIPTFNREKELARCINSVLKQTEKNWEVIVVVDNSQNDKTKNLLDEIADPRIRHIEVQNKGVIAFSRNTGVSEAKADFVAFLDDDDWWMPEKLACCLRRLSEGNDIVYHDMYFRSARNKSFSVIFKARCLSDENPYRDLLIYGNGLITSSVVLRKDIFRLAGEMSEEVDLIAGEDYDYWLRLAKLNFKFSRIAKPLGYYWKGGNTSSVKRMPRILRKLRQLHGYKEESKTFYIYSQGRAYFLLHKYERARKFLKYVLCLERRRLVIILKAIWMLSYIFVRNIFHG